MALAVLFSSGCEPALDARSVLLIDTIINADRDLIATRPGLVARKYQTMAGGLQPFLRGTAAVFYRDLSRYQGDSAMVFHGPLTEQTQLYGDLHLENLGVSFDSQGVLFDVVDFDATIRGPFAWELRRSALALRTALFLAGQDDAALDQAIRSLAQQYSQTILEHAEVSQDTPLRETDPKAGRIVAELLADGRKRNDQQEELSQYTELREGQRKLRRNEDLIDLSQPWLRDLPTLLLRYRATRLAGPLDDTQMVVLDAAQRLNAGVASLPNLRFWVLLSGPNLNGRTKKQDAEWILEFKEERDPPFPLMWLSRGPLGRNDERVFAGTKKLRASMSSEADLGAFEFAGVSFQARRVLRGRRDLDVQKLSERLLSGRYGRQDILDLGGAMGILLANGHARSGHARAIWEVLDDNDRAATFADSLVARSRSDLDRLRGDFLLFQAALHRLGPLLGYWVEAGVTHE